MKKIKLISLVLAFSMTAFVDASIYPIALLDYQIHLGKSGNRHADPTAVLGNNFHQVSLGEGGWLAVEMAQNVYDGQGIDLIIEESATGSAETYEVFVADHNLAFISVGWFRGNAEIDLKSTGLASINYVYIHDSPADQRQSAISPGVDIIKIIGLHEHGS